MDLTLTLSIIHNYIPIFMIAYQFIVVYGGMHAPLFCFLIFVFDCSLLQSVNKVVALFCSKQKLLITKLC